METYNMAYLNETSSVKTIVPGAEVSGFADVVARQKIGEVSAEVPKLSAGEGIGLTTVNGKTVITNNISAGENISLVYDQETNTYRIDGEGGSVEGLYVPLSATDCAIGYLNLAFVDSFAQGGSCSASLYSFAQGGSCSATGASLAQGNHSTAFNFSLAQGFRNKAISSSLAQGEDNYAEKYSQALGFRVSATNNGMAIGTYNKTTSGAFVIGNGNGAGGLSDAFIVNHDGSVSAAGKISANGVELGAGKIYTGVAPIQVNNTTDQISITGESLSAGPGIDLFSSGGYVVISAIPSNTCCVRFTDTLTSVDLSSYLNYDKVTIVHSNDGAADCNLYWDGKTKVFPSGLYCEMVKGTNEQNVVKWSFANSGWINDNWWDWD